MARWVWNSLATWAVFCMLTAACRSGADHQRQGELHGTITVSGAWALYPLVVRWGEEFSSVHPDVRFDISAGGAGKGMSDVLGGLVDIAMVSRAVRPEEISQGAFPIPVARDAVFLTVNENNPVWEDLRQHGVRRETLVGIYLGGTVTTWGEVVGRPEVTHPIHVYTRSDAAGAPETWAQYLGGEQEDLLGVGVYGDPGILEAVIRDPLGMGYNNLNYAFDAETELPVRGARVVPLDTNDNGQVDPEESLDTRAQALRAVATGIYPSPPARTLYLVTRGTPTEVVRAFLVWVLTDGQANLSEAGYVPLGQESLGAVLAQLEAP